MFNYALFIWASSSLHFLFLFLFLLLLLLISPSLSFLPSFSPTVFLFSNVGYKTWSDWPQTVLAEVNDFSICLFFNFLDCNMSLYYQKNDWICLPLKNIQMSVNIYLFIICSDCCPNIEVGQTNFLCCFCIIVLYYEGMIHSGTKCYGLL